MKRSNLWILRRASKTRYIKASLSELCTPSGTRRHIALSRLTTPTTHLAISGGSRVTTFSCEVTIDYSIAFSVINDMCKDFRGIIMQARAGELDLLRCPALQIELKRRGPTTKWELYRDSLDNLLRKANEDDWQWHIVRM
jgi:hypothetical protein